MAFVCGRFNLYGTNLITLAYQEVNLIKFGLLRSILLPESIVIQRVAGCAHKLSHHILVHIAQIRGELISQKLLIN